MNNITLLDDLPNLDELEDQPKSMGLGMIPNNEANKYQKFIRNSGFKTPDESGMNSRNMTPVNMNINMQPGMNPIMAPIGMDPNMNQPGMLRGEMMSFHGQHPKGIAPHMINSQQQPQHEKIHHQRGHYSHFSDTTPPPNMSFNDSNVIDPNPYQPYASERVYENFDVNIKPSGGSHSCIDVAEHTHNCLVCSKLYTNNNTLLLIIISFLALVNLLLIKKILENEK